MKNDAYDPYKVLFIILFIIGIIGITIYGIKVVGMQQEYDKSCKKKCNIINYSDYKTTFWSSWNDVNGRCYCIDKIEIT